MSRERRDCRNCDGEGDYWCEDEGEAVVCPECRGLKWFPRKENGETDCPVCEGYGRIPEKRGHGIVERTCAACDGEGVA